MDLHETLKAEFDLTKKNNLDLIDRLESAQRTVDALALPTRAQGYCAKCPQLLKAAREAESKALSLENQITALKKQLDQREDPGFEARLQLALANSLAVPANLNMELETKYGSGMNNFSNCCFLNATSQMLLHMEPVRDWLLRQIHTHPKLTEEEKKIEKKSAEQLCVTCSFKTVYVKTLNSTQAFEATDLIELLKTINSGMEKGRQEDAQEFLIGLQAAFLHEQYVDKGLSTIRPSSGPLLRNVFAGIYCDVFTCHSCLHTWNKQSDFESDLLLSIDKATSVDEVLANFVAEDEKPGFKCPECREVNVSATRRFMTTPKYLVISLARFSYDTALQRRVKDNKPVTVTGACDLTPFLLNGVSTARYNLVSVVRHVGHAATSGHYIMNMIDRANNVAIQYNDGEVSATTIAEMLRLASITAYILAYELDQEQVEKQKETSKETAGGLERVQQTKQLETKKDVAEEMNKGQQVTKKPAQVSQAVQQVTKKSAGQVAESKILGEKRPPQDDQSKAMKKPRSKPAGDEDKTLLARLIRKISSIEKQLEEAAVLLKKRNSTVFNFSGYEQLPTSFKNQIAVQADRAKQWEVFIAELEKQLGEARQFKKSLTGESADEEPAGLIEAIKKFLLSPLRALMKQPQKRAIENGDTSNGVSPPKRTKRPKKKQDDDDEDDDDKPAPTAPVAKQHKQKSVTTVTAG